MENKLCFWVSLIFKDEVLNVTHKQSIVNKIRKSKIKGIIFPYTCLGEQDTGIETLSQKFRIDKNFMINKIPLRHMYKDGIYILTTTEDVNINVNVKNAVKIKGITAYWDEENLIILSTKEFNFILKLLRYEFNKETSIYHWRHSLSRIRRWCLFSIQKRRWRIRRKSC